jgi:hypothetical protein
VREAIMDVKNLLTICKKYAELGGAVQAQLHAAVNREITIDNFNPNSFFYIEEFLQTALVNADEVADDCDDTISYVEEIMAEWDSDDED